MSRSRGYGERIVAFALIVLLGSLLAVGCGGSSAAPPQTGPTGRPAPPPAPPETPPTPPATAPTVLKQFPHVPKESIKVAFSADGKYLAAGGEKGMVKLWDAADGKELFAKSIGGEVNSLLFSPDAKWLVAGKSGGPVTVWTVPTGQEHWAIVDDKPVPMSYEAVGFLPDGKSLVTFGYPGPVKVWDVAAKTQTAKGESVPTGLEALVLSADGKWAAAGQGAQSDAKPAPRVSLHDIPSGKQRGEPLPQTEGTEVLALSPDGKQLASVKGWASHPSTTINLWDLPAGKLKVELKGHTDKILALAFSPDGKYLASGGWDKTVRLWDAGTGQELTQLKAENWVYGLAFGPQSKTLAVGGWMPNVTLWDLSPALRAGKQ